MDDEPDILLPILRSLKLRRFEVDGFTNPLDVLGVFQRGKYALAILDVSLPGLTGFQLAKKLLSRDPNIEIAFISGWPHFETKFKLEFPHLAEDRFLLKPISVDQLRHFIRSVLVHDSDLCNKNELYDMENMC